MPSNILLIGAVRGLISEGDKVKSAFEKFKPDIIAISVSKESVLAMAEHITKKNEAPEPANQEEDMYIEGLKKFGEVVRPPPCYSEAWKMASKNNIPIKGLDMDEEHFTAAYCKYISTMDMVRQSRSDKKWARHVFISKTPEDFVLEWDSIVNKLPSYQALEQAREKWIAKGISILAKKYDKILVIVEFERLAGIQNFLESMGCNFQTLDSDSRI